MAIPRYLYKFQSVTSNSLANLTNRQIWFSKPSEFNDPFDCAIRVDTAPIPEEDFDRLLDLYAKEGADPDSVETLFRPNGVPMDETKRRIGAAIAKAFEERQKTMLNERGVACFSARFNHLLMWSHYAEAHKGFCLQFSTENEPFGKALAVSYQEMIPSVNPVSVIRESDPPALMLMITTKSSCWQHEEEWRIFHEQPDIGFSYAPKSLVGMYFGARMSQANKLMIAKLLDGSPTELYQIELSHDSYSVVAEPLTFAAI
jgi:hypothetical protein